MKAPLPRSWLRRLGERLSPSHPAPAPVETGWLEEEYCITTPAAAPADPWDPFPAATAGVVEELTAATGVDVLEEAPPASAAQDSSDDNDDESHLPLTSAADSDDAAPTAEAWEWEAAPPNDAWEWHDTAVIAAVPEMPLPSAVPDLDLPDFDPKARQLIWQPLDEADSPLHRRARFKAALIASEMDVRSRAEMDEAVAWLTEFFVRDRHGATFAALQRAVGQNVDLPLLQNMAELRGIWLMRPKWWLAKSKTGTAYCPKNAHHQFSWTVARRVCVGRSEFPPSGMIDEDWLKEWLRTPLQDEQHKTFAAFIDWKSCRREAELLHCGLSMEYSGGIGVEVADDWQWYRGIDWEEDLAPEIHFCLRTPWDRRPGQIEYRPDDD